tara:strand:- start:152 stop:697 length:546 start_codon:yes stop_codon:yes gene_type:complete
MKFNYLLKSIPFLSTLLFIAFIYFNNQKISTKIRILIWNTPSYSLGNYLAISVGSGFILSYLGTSKLASIIRNNSDKKIPYKPDIANEENNEYSFSNFKITKEKTLIERNINDPSPTVNAQFRVIGKTERYNNNYIDNNNIQYDYSSDYDESYSEKNVNNETINQDKKVSTDWNDDSFTSW